MKVKQKCRQRLCFASVKGAHALLQPLDKCSRSSCRSNKPSRVGDLPIGCLIKSSRESSYDRRLVEVKSHDEVVAKGTRYELKAESVWQRRREGNDELVARQLRDAADKHRQLNGKAMAQRVGSGLSCSPFTIPRVYGAGNALETAQEDDAL